MFFFNLVEHKVRLFTNKQIFLTLLHLRPFRQFQNLSEKTRSRATENLIELCFVAFLSNKSKKCFIFVWIIFPSSEFIAISILHCVVWTFWQQTLNLNELNFYVKFCETEAGNIQATFHILLAYVGVGYLEKFKIFNLVASAWDSKSRFDQSD